MRVTPHVAQNTKNRRNAIDARTTGHPGNAISQRKRKRVEEIFGWMKTVGLLRKLRHRGGRRVTWIFRSPGPATRGGFSRGTRQCDVCYVCAIALRSSTKEGA